MIRPDGELRGVRCDINIIKTHIKHCPPSSQSVLTNLPAQHEANTPGLAGPPPTGLLCGESVQETGEDQGWARDQEESQEGQDLPNY